MRRQSFALALFAFCALLFVHSQETPAQDKAAFDARILDVFQARNIGPANMGGRIVDLAVVEKNPNAYYSNMREPPYALNSERRKVVLAMIREVCRHRGWKSWACHVRTTHVHVVVSAEAKPEKSMSDLKAYASRRLREKLNEIANAKRWTQHGSTRYLWKANDVAAKVDYTLNGQGDPMERNDARSEPEA